MPGLDDATTALERILGESLPGDAPKCRRFALREGTLLLRELPGGGGASLAASVEAVPRKFPEREREEVSRAFLQLRLARLRLRPHIEATLDPEAGWTVFFRFSLDASGEWLERIRELLNEAQILRSLMSPDGGGARDGTAAQRGAFPQEGLFRMRH